jgi:hypothetical protein
VCVDLSPASAVVIPNKTTVRRPEAKSRIRKLAFTANAKDETSPAAPATDWGERRFGYASLAYAQEAFTEAYGVEV